jgi:hypothetical protein
MCIFCGLSTLLWAQHQRRSAPSLVQVEQRPGRSQVCAIQGCSFKRTLFFSSGQQGQGIRRPFVQGGSRDSSVTPGMSSRAPTLCVIDDEDVALHPHALPASRKSIERTWGQERFRGQSGRSVMWMRAGFKQAWLGRLVGTSAAKLRLIFRCSFLT